MSLLDKQEIKPKIVNVMLLDNEEQNKENEDIIIEEINDNEEEKEKEKEKEEKVEEVKEEEKEEEVKELLSEGLRKRKKSAHFHVSSQTRNK